MPQILALPQLTVDLVRAAQVVKGPLKSVPAADLQRLELDYRRFLALIAEYQDETLAPTQAIDEMWHLHMLHPVAYHRDCMAIFGYLLDHDAGFGASDEESPRLQTYFDYTGELWQRAFNRLYQSAQLGAELAVIPPPTCTSQPKPSPEPEAPASPEHEPEQDSVPGTFVAVIPPPTCTSKPKQPTPEPEAPGDPEAEPEQDRAA